MARNECKHGTLVSQCRCICGKTVIVACPPDCPEKEKDTNATKS